MGVLPQCTGNRLSTCFEDPLTRGSLVKLLKRVPTIQKADN